MPRCWGQRGIDRRDRPVTGITSRPNIVLIHWHDLGTHIGPYGHRGVETPYLNRLASQSLRFTHAYSTAPQCSPARGSLFTGRYPHNNGLMGLAHRGWEYHPDVQTAPMLLSACGYHTALIGLQHESADPRTLGFDEVVDYTSEKPYGDEVAAQAVEWLDAAPDEPFFLTVGLYETHRPYPAHRYASAPPDGLQVPPYLPDNEHTRADLAAFAGAIKAGDQATGRIIEAIDRAQLADNTLVIFTTDHGPAFPRAKGSLYDPGLHVALIIRPPSSWGVAPGERHQLTSHVDLLPTLLAMAEGQVPASVQGRDFSGLFSDADSEHRDAIFAEKTYHESYDPLRCIRTLDVKYIRNYDDGPLLRLAPDIEDSLTRRGLGDAHLAPRPSEELYDLRHDPHETHNLASSRAYGPIKQRLSQRLQHWQEQSRDPILDGPVAGPRALQNR